MTTVVLVVRRASASFAALLLIFTLVVVAPSKPVSAGSGMNTYWWWQSGITVGPSSYKYSNATGFWQAIINSPTGCTTQVDGIYGSVTQWWAAHTQNVIIGSNNGGIMDSWAMSNIQLAKAPGGFTRLQNTGVTDGYGTQKIYYYGGSASNAELGWNPISQQWLFSPTPTSNPNLLIPALSSRTMGSYAPCA